jgi:hypothetical protein
VEQCSPRGFLLRPQEGDAQTWTHDEVFATFAAGGLVHFPVHSRNADQRIDGLRSRSWDSFGPSRRREAMRRLAYAKEADRLIQAGEGQVDACKKAAESVFTANIEAWTTEERDAAIAARARSTQKASRRPVDPDAPVELPTSLKKHSWSSVRVWLKRWRDNGRDVRALIPNKEWRGNRTPRVGMTVERLEIFTEVIREFYLQPTKRRTKRSLYKIYSDKCRRAGITQVEEYSSFCKRIKRESPIGRISPGNSGGVRRS